MKKKNNLKKTISIIIPTYNEKDNIYKLLIKILLVLPHAKVVVVDDSPNDKTLEKIRGLLKKNHSIKALSRKKKAGRGSAVLDGLAYALKQFNSDLYIEMDADLSHDPSELVSIIRASSAKKVVVASRYIKGSKIMNWPIERRIASKVSNFLVRTILNIPLNDNTNGYRAYSRDAVCYILSRRFISSGHIVLSETAYSLMKKGYFFVEVPSVFHNRRKGRSSANLKEFLIAFKDLLLIRFKS